MSKKNKKATSKSTEKRPAKRKKIVSLAQYEADAKRERPDTGVAATVDAVEKGNLAEGITAPAGKKGKLKSDMPAKERKAGGLDAAAQVLADAGEPLNTKDMVDRMLAKGLWKTEGKTPAATIYAAIIREIAIKGGESRFRKVGKGMFDLAK